MDQNFKKEIMNKRYNSLDGWRGISILLVIAGHWFPLGPKWLHFNAAIASTGMAIFFILSGFLITRVLIVNNNLKHFIVRRFARIIPLSWLVLVVFLLFNNATAHQYVANLFFYANWPPMAFMRGIGHFWSLCVEMQFYVFIAILVALFKKKAFYCLPILCFFITFYRYVNEVPMAINTYYRIDEILAGCCLALIYSSHNNKMKEILSRLYTPILMLLLILSAHPDIILMNYLRPYIALLLVSSTLFCKKNNWSLKLLQNKHLAYVANISYALYVIHGVLGHTWLGEGGKLVKYSKRPLLIVVTWFLAHVSTFYYESFWIKLGKKYSSNNCQAPALSSTTKKVDKSDNCIAFSYKSPERSIKKQNLTLP